MAIELPFFPNNWKWSMGAQSLLWGLCAMQTMDRRKTTRHELRIPVEISGFTASGEFFTEQTNTEEVSREGCHFPLRRRIADGRLLGLKLLIPAAPEEACHGYGCSGPPGCDQPAKCGWLAPQSSIPNLFGSCPNRRGAPAPRGVSSSRRCLGRGRLRACRACRVRCAPLKPAA